MTLTAFAMSLNPKYYFIGSIVVIVLLACVEHGTNAVEAPTAPAEMMNEEEVVWSHGVMGHLHWWLDCDAIHESNRNNPALEPHNETVWKLLHDTYRDVVHKDLQNLPPSSTDESLKGFQVPVETKRTTALAVPTTEDGEELEAFPLHSLGIFATEAIPKGTLVWKSHNTAQFPTGHDFRSFLKALPEYLACDVLDWAFPRFQLANADQRELSPLVCVDLDHGSLTNVCDGEGDCNLAILSDEHTFSGCALEFHATRDIAVGEELKFDHNFHEHIEAYFSLGLAHPVYYEEGEGAGDEEPYEEEQEF